MTLGLNPPDHKGKQCVHLSRTHNNSGERSTEHESRASVASAGFGKKETPTLAGRGMVLDWLNFIFGFTLHGEVFSHKVDAITELAYLVEGNVSLFG